MDNMKSALVAVGSLLLISCGGDPSDGNERSSSSLFKKAPGESCTFNAQCSGNVDSFGVPLVCRPGSGEVGNPDYRCQSKGNTGDFCFDDSECLTGLACQNAMKSFFQDWSNPTDTAGACAVSNHVTSIQLPPGTCNDDTCPNGTCDGDTCYPAS